jgi:hypothetical protein
MLSERRLAFNAKLANSLLDPFLDAKNEASQQQRPLRVEACLA